MSPVHTAHDTLLAALATAESVSVTLLGSETDDVGSFVAYGLSVDSTLLFVARFEREGHRVGCRLTSIVKGVEAYHLGHIRHGADLVCRLVDALDQARNEADKADAKDLFADRDSHPLQGILNLNTRQLMFWRL